MAKFKITVSKPKCIGSEDCVETTPTVFQLDADGKSEVHNPTGAPDGAIIAAARSCPVKAIIVVDEETGEQLFSATEEIAAQDPTITLRKKQPGTLVVEQTRDIAAVRAMLVDAGMITDGLEWPPACYIAAYFGMELVGVVGVEPMLDAALIRSLYVIDTMRKRGFGTGLVSAARKAAHTRGAKSLYLFSTDAGDFFKRLGFSEVPVPQLFDALSGAPQVEYYRARPEQLAREVAWYLDISQDGVILR